MSYIYFDSFTNEARLTSEDFDEVLNHREGAYGKIVIVCALLFLARSRAALPTSIARVRVECRAVDLRSSTGMEPPSMNVLIEVGQFPLGEESLSRRRSPSRALLSTLSHK